MTTNENISNAAKLNILIGWLNLWNMTIWNMTWFLFVRTLNDETKFEMLYMICQ